MRWNIRDRMTGEVKIIANPANFKGREALKTAIHGVTTIGQRW